MKVQVVHRAGRRPTNHMDQRICDICSAAIPREVWHAHQQHHHAVEGLIGELADRIEEFTRVLRDALGEAEPEPEIPWAWHAAVADGTEEDDNERAQQPVLRSGPGRRTPGRRAIRR